MPPTRNVTSVPTQPSSHVPTAEPERLAEFPSAPWEITLSGVLRNRRRMDHFLADVPDEGPGNNLAASFVSRSLLSTSIFDGGVEKGDCEGRLSAIARPCRKARALQRAAAYATARPGQSAPWFLTASTAHSDRSHERGRGENVQDCLRIPGADPRGERQGHQGDRRGEKDPAHFGSSGTHDCR